MVFEPVMMFSFQDLGQCLVKKIRELNGDNLVSGKIGAINDGRFMRDRNCAN